MKLITETFEDVKPIIESREDGKKNYFIQGIMLQAESVNRNGRSYPIAILENEIQNYQNNFISKKRALGELNHPAGPTVNLDRCSHMIVEITKNGFDFHGKAKILDTPMGLIVQSLINEGALLGVSSRGMGSLQKINNVNVVQPDFSLSAIDIVSDPSAPHAFVNGIMEGKEWIWSNGILEEQIIDSFKKEIIKTPRKLLEKKALYLFEKFLKGM
jgi:hypothetical protein